MQVTRLDLDGTGSPLGLAGKILEAEPTLVIPVPIEDLARQLDIQDIAELTTEGFEGGLITDDVRSSGIVLVRKGMNRHRRRFTIGHELGHFLIPTHRPATPQGFLCSARDLNKWSNNQQDRAGRMEAEANRFAAAILLPPPHLRRFMNGFGNPHLEQALAIHEHFDVSKEAAARAYASHHRGRVAVVVAHNNRVLRIYRSSTLPKLCVAPGSTLPRLNVPTSSPGSLSRMELGRSEFWLESEWGKRLPRVYEQVLFQKDTFALIMLWCEEGEDDEDYDPEEGKTAKERYRDRMEAKHRF